MASTTPLTDLIVTRERANDFSAFGLVLPNPDPILKAQGKDISTYRNLRVDAHVGGCIRRRKSAVKALERGIDRDTSPSRIAKSIESIFADLDMDRIIAEMTDAVLYGYQPMEIMWGRVGNLLVPVDIVGKPPEWFVFGADNQLRFRARGHAMQGVELPDRKFLLPRQDATYQNPYGFADLSMCFWPVFFKKGGIKLWLQFAEKFGGAFAVGKLPRSASPTEREELLESLDALIANGVATIPDDGSVELVESAGKAASSDLYERLVMFCRSEVSIALTGTNQTTEANSNKASASAGLEVADDLRDGDAGIVAAALNQLIRWTVDLNWSGAEAPVYGFWDQEAQDALQASRDKSNHEAGANFTNAYWMRAYGYKEGDLAESGAVVQPAPANPTAVAFAENDPVAGEVAQLSSAAEVPAGELVASIGDLVVAAKDLPSLQKVLIDTYGSLDTDRLAEIMAAAFALAELKGMADVATEKAA